MPDQSAPGWTKVAEPEGWTAVAPAPAAPLPTAAAPAASGATPTHPHARVGQAAMNFISELQSLNPMSYVRSAYQAVTSPVETVQGIGQAQGEQFTKMQEAYDKGDYLGAARYALGYAIPLLGPQLSNAADELEKGNVAAGLGKTADVGLQIAAPKIIEAIPKGGPRVPGPVGNRNPVQAAAVAYGKAEGIPIDAATATNNPFVRGVQKLADESALGSVVSGRARAAQQTALTRTGENLAARAHPTAVTPEQAGQAVRDTTLGKVSEHAAAADVAYDRLRQIEADPAHVQPVEIAPAPGSKGAALGSDMPGPDGRFASYGASDAELFEGVLGDARRSGFTGDAEALRAEFNKRLEKAKRYDRGGAVDAGSDISDAELLREIRRLGGIDPKAASNVDALREIQGMRNQRGAASIVRQGGIGFDQLVQELHQSPKWAQTIPDDAALMDRLQRIKAGGSGGFGQGYVDPESTLRGAFGVEPGAQWWKQTPADNVTSMALPVDLRVAKEALKPIYDRLMRQYPVTQQQASAGLKAIENIVNGPDFGPLTQVDADLSAIKTIARSDIPELRSVSQGTAAQAVKQLDDWIKVTAERAGPDALDALEAGRRATIEKYGAADVLEQIQGKTGKNFEPVGEFRRLTAPKDSAIAQLREVAKQAPYELPKIGRAYLDDLLLKATERGGFGRAGRLLSEWEKLGPETKRSLFPNAQHRADLDNFFRLSERIADNPNPSGSALTAVKGAEGTLLVTNPALGVPMTLGSAALSALLHSKIGVRLLTEGFRIPAASPAAAAAYVARLTHAAKQAAPAMPVPAVAGTEPPK